MDKNKIAFKFNLLHFVVAVLLFFVEVFIAVYIHDDFIRPYIGDVLVVIFLYYLVKSFIGLGDSKLANIIIGNSFAWADIVAYTAGIVVVLVVEQGLRKK